MAPEDDPADDREPTEEEWDEFERRAAAPKDDETAEWTPPAELGGES
jgi:hypothetical protein